MPTITAVAVVIPPADLWVGPMVFIAILTQDKTARPRRDATIRGDGSTIVRQLTGGRQYAQLRRNGQRRKDPVGRALRTDTQVLAAVDDGGRPAQARPCEDRGTGRGTSVRPSLMVEQVHGRPGRRHTATRRSACWEELTAAHRPPAWTPLRLPAPRIAAPPLQLQVARSVTGVEAVAELVDLGHSCAEGGPVGA
jgi:hypothetical protein